MPQPKKRKYGEDMLAIHKKTKNHHILQQVYGQHQLFRHDAVHLFGRKVDNASLKKRSFQNYSQDGGE
jgi:hypothetical protein